MRVLILGGTRFIGRRITTDLMARGDDVTVVHRGDHEPAELAGCAHLHTACPTPNWCCCPASTCTGPMSCCWPGRAASRYR